MHIFDSFVHVLLSFGIAGILVLAILDSSVFFFGPLAIDVLYIILVSRHHDRMPLYILIVTAGSILGCAITYWVISKAGEETIEKRFSRSLFEKFKRQVDQKGFVAVMAAALMPPPLPFTAFIAAASVAQMRLKKLLAAVATGRVLRFGIEGGLAIVFGRHILRLMESDGFKLTVCSLFVLAMIGSCVTAVRWLRNPVMKRHS